MGTSSLTLPEGIGRTLAKTALLVAALLAPFRILAHGFLPMDDALRHSAFAVSGKAWTDILISRPGAQFDQSPGWHAILRALHGAFGWDADALAAFSVGFLLLVFFLCGLPWVRRWESWFISVLLLSLSDWTLIHRFSLGRPFIFTTVVCLLMLGSFEGPEPEGRRLSWREPAIAAGVALCTWIHGSWYLFGMPVLAFVLAGKPRTALRLAVAVGVGVLLGACLTGAPLKHLAYHLGHLGSAFLRPSSDRALVIEFLPGTLSYEFLLTVGLVAVVCRRHLTPENTWRDPALWLGILGWVLGFSVVRFATDWAFPPLLYWTARRLDEAIEGWRDRWEPWRLKAGLATALAFYAVMTSRIDDHWAPNRDTTFLTPRNPEIAGWLPGEGGVLYSPSMRVFMQTFFANPKGPWRYALGYEPGMMTEENFKVFDQSRAGTPPDRAFRDWTRAMGPADRLVLLGSRRVPPPIPELEWKFIAPDKWFGRKPREAPAP